MSARRRTFAVVAVGAFMAQLDLFIVNLAFPSIQADFDGVSNASLSWVLNAYAIVFAACLVPAGRLGDLLGRRRTFELGLALFALGSAACAAAPGLGVLVAARVLQALGAALVIPTSLGLLLHGLEPAARPAAIGAWASVGAVAAASGPPLGGLLVEADWRWIFLVNLPLAIGALLLSRRWVEEVRHPDAGGRPDLLGIGLLVGGIGTLVLSIVRSPDWGAAEVAAGVAGAVLLLGVFLARCRTHPAPVIELPLLRVRAFAVANATMLAFYVGFGAMLLISVLFLTGPWHLGTVEAGLAIAPGPLTVALLSMHVKHLTVRFGARPVVVLGCVLVAAGATWWATMLDETPDYAAEFLPGMLVGGLGVALTQASLFGVAATVLPAHRFATGSGVLNMSRQIGLALGVAVLVAILGTAPDLADFRAGWAEMALSGLAAAGVAALLPGRVRSSSVVAHDVQLTAATAGERALP
jgi:EmrB/QacA subfamily drug resistance transporter